MDLFGPSLDPLVRDGKDSIRLDLDLFGPSLDPLVRNVKVFIRLDLDLFGPSLGLCPIRQNECPMSGHKKSMLKPCLNDLKHERE